MARTAISFASASAASRQRPTSFSSSTATASKKRRSEPQSLDDDPLICAVDVSGGGAAWNVAAFRRGGDARSIPRIRIPGEHTRDRSVIVGQLAEILKNHDQ